MTPKEKATDILDKYKTFVVMWASGVKVENENAKQCALIAVDEIIKLVNALPIDPEVGFADEYEKYWLKVKEEISNL